MTEIGNELDYYLQAFRLHQGLSKGGNAEAQRLLRSAIAIGIENGSTFGRAFGLLSFTIQNGWLSNWIDKADAEQILDDAIDDVDAATTEHDLPLETLDTLKSTSKLEIDTMIKAVIIGYAKTATNLDDTDYDNRWSLATATLYNDPNNDAVDQYKTLHDDTSALPIPEVCKGSLDCDYADALFFAGDPPNTNEAAILQAIGLVEAAIENNPTDPKRHRWNWTLGWAYYELGAFVNPTANCLKALAILHKIRTPHDLIRKNIMAAYVGAEMTDAAKPLAKDFMLRNEGYTLAVEDRWPYRNPVQLERWKAHLSLAGLPD